VVVAAQSLRDEAGVVGVDPLHQGGVVLLAQVQQRVVLWRRVHARLVRLDNADQVVVVRVAVLAQPAEEGRDARELLAQERLVAAGLYDTLQRVGDHRRLDGGGEIGVAQVDGVMLHPLRIAPPEDDVRDEPVRLCGGEQGR